MTRILLVEDDLNIIENLKELLKAEGFEVIAVSRQSEALKYLDEEKFDLILLDISLPDGSGYAICSAAKANTIDNLNKDVPVIFITAYDDEINAVTGYIRGGCTAIGMKKQYNTVIHKAAMNLETMIVSGGRIGSQIELKPEDLKVAVNAEFSDVLL